MLSYGTVEDLEDGGSTFLPKRQYYQIYQSRRIANLKYQISVFSYVYARKP